MQYFVIPKYKDLELFFNEKFNRNFSSQEQKIASFFHHQVADALRQNIETSSLQLCATMIAMLSTPNRQAYCLTTRNFAGTEKRNAFARTVGALFLEKVGDLNDIIRETNDKTAQRISDDLATRPTDKFFEEIGACSIDEKAAMKEFCTDYTIFLASKIFSCFTPCEISTWQKSRLPSPNSLLNHPRERLAMLGHSEERLNDASMTANPQTNIYNPYGYSLRTRGQKRAFLE